MSELDQNAHETVQTPDLKALGQRFKYINNARFVMSNNSLPIGGGGVADDETLQIRFANFSPGRRINTLIYRRQKKEKKLIVNCLFYTVKMHST